MLLVAVVIASVKSAIAAAPALAALVTQVTVPLPSVVKTWLAEPSAVGKVYAEFIVNAPT